MKLDVLKTESPWYEGGMDFTCTQCGNCCSGPPGFVWITRDEIVRLAEHLEMTPEDVVEKYCRMVGGQFSLRERRNAQGQYDCIFLREIPAEKLKADGTKGGAPIGEAINQSKRVCGIYSARPLQCRTWPFWSGNLQSKTAWDAAAVRCHGMNRGRHFTEQEIAALRDADDWPKGKEAPTS